MLVRYRQLLGYVLCSLMLLNGGCGGNSRSAVRIPIRVDLGTLQLSGVHASDAVPEIVNRCGAWCDGKIYLWADRDAVAGVWSLVFLHGVDTIDRVGQVECARGLTPECPMPHPDFVEPVDDELLYYELRHQQIVPCEAGQVRIETTTRVVYGAGWEIMASALEMPNIYYSKIHFEACVISGALLSDSILEQRITVSGTRELWSSQIADFDRGFGQAEFTTRDDITLKTDDGTGAPFWTDRVVTDEYYFEHARLGGDTPSSVMTNGGTCFGAGIEFGPDPTNVADDHCRAGGIAFYPLGWSAL